MREMAEDAPPDDLSGLPVPIERLSLPAALDGSTGTNRGGGKMQISANTDLQAMQAWLARFVDSPATFANYRKEAERLLLWATSARHKAVSSLTHEDFLAYSRFLLDPQPREQWVSGGGTKYPRHDVRWRPFYGPLSPASQRQAMVILNVMFSWLVHAGYLGGNPLALTRHRAARKAPRVVRYLDPELWDDVKRSIESMPRNSGRERAHHQRVRWLFTLLYLGGLRISEVSGNTMGGFFCRRSHGEERWWLQILGKGDKERLVPATHEMMLELANYRQSRGLPPYPAINEATPLVLPLGPSVKPLTRAALHTIIKKVFEEAACALERQGGANQARAALLRQASAHWLRHTAGSSMADGEIDLRMVRDNLGHESLNTTSQYLHTDDDRRHRETERCHRIVWPGKPV